MTRAFSFLALLAFAAAGGLAQTPTADDDVRVATVVLVPALDLQGGWLELTHLASDEPPLVVDLGHRKASGEPLRITPPLPAGPTLLCSGGHPYGVACEEVYRGAGELAGPPEVEVAFHEGVRVRGIYYHDGLPVAGALVAVVPAGLEASRPFTLPLGLGRREVETADDGGFVLPEIAPGTYFLETLLPTGRVHRSDPFDLPSREELLARTRTEAEATDETTAKPEDEDEPFFDLGILDVAAGLRLAVRAVDPTGRPIAGALVTARQGRTVRELLVFADVTGADGGAVLDGFVVELPVVVGCDRAGYAPFEEEYALVPVEIDCTLDPWAEVTGEILGQDAEPLRGTRVTVRRAEDEEDTEEESEEEKSGVSSGIFLVPELSPGDYVLTAAAPGRETEERTFTVAAGERLDLGAIVLLPGRRLEGRTVDKESGEPLAGIEIEAVDPPGAAFATSDAEGDFVLEVGRRRDVTLRFTTLDYAPKELVLTVDEIAAGDPLTVELEPAGFVLVQVEDKGGHPCQGCRAVLRPEGEELVTDEGGEAMSGPLAAGRYRVARPRTTHLGSTVVEHPDAEVLRLRVSSGEVTVARFKAPGREVRVRVVGDLGDTFRTLVARSPSRSWRIEPEPGGDFVVRQRPGDGLELFLAGWDAAAGAEVEVWQGTLPLGFAGDEARLELSGSRLSGRAVGADGPLAGASVRLLRIADLTPAATTSTDGQGRFAIPHVAPGVYTVFVGARSVQFVSLRPRQVLDLGTFELPLGITSSEQELPSYVPPKF